MKMLKLLSVFCLLIGFNSLGQSTNKFSSTDQDQIKVITDSIVAEGKMLYRSEMASWYGTDLFVEKFKDQSKIGGYFSYLESDKAKCIFFSKGESPVVIGTIIFDSTYNTSAALASLDERAFTKTETDYYQIRTKALKIINTDTIFKTYKNTNLNLIPVISGNEKKVYVLTGTNQNGLLIIGNDYLINFDEGNQITRIKMLHRNIIPIEFGKKEEDGNPIVGSVHSHLPETGEFITATDICTLMLYKNFTKWKSHTVVSEHYISIWNCESDALITIPRPQEEDNKDQDQKRKKNKN